MIKSFVALICLAAIVVCSVLAVDVPNINDIPDMGFVAVALTASVVLGCILGSVDSKAPQ